MSFWWVNQGGSYVEERRVGCIFASKISPGGLRLKHHWAVRDVRRDDVILHNVKSRLVALGIVKGMYWEQERPYERRGYPKNFGFLAPVDYHVLDAPIRVDDIPLEWRKEEASNNEWSPFTTEGAVWLAYLTPLSECFGCRFVERYRPHLPDVILAHVDKR